MNQKLLLRAATMLLTLPLMFSGCGQIPTPSPSVTPNDAQGSDDSNQASQPSGEAAAPAPSQSTPEGPRVETFSLGRLTRGEALYEYDGQQVTRKFFYYIPSTYTEGDRLPLMLSLHGSGSNATMQLGEGRWVDYAEQEGIIIVAPESTALHANGKISSEGKLPYEIGQSDAAYVRWAAASTDPCVQFGVDDVQYLSDLIDLFVNSGYADAERVYSSGLSHGAFMSLRLTLELPEKIAGVGIVAGLLCTEFKDVQMSKSVKIVLIHGTQDTIVPIQGMNYPSGGESTAEQLWAYSSNETVAWFLEQYGMDNRPTVSQLPDTDPEDGTTITRRAYADEAGRELIVQYVVDGGGHTWPGGTQYAPISVCGVVSREAQAAELIWSELQAGF